MVSKLEGLSLDLEVINKEKLKSVFPECFSEGTLDIDKLLSLCGEYIDNDFEYPYDVRCNLFARCFNEAEIILMETAID